MNKYIILLLLSLVFSTVTAQNNETEQTEQALQILQQRGELVIKFNAATKAQINGDFGKFMSIDRVTELPGGQGYEVRAYMGQQGFQEFLTRQIPYVILPKSHDKALTMATTTAEMANWDRYPIYSVYEQMMANFASTYPNLCDIDTILSATPSGNYKILVAKISDNVTTAENEPQLLYSSSIHGDETTGYYLMLRLINYLLTNYGTDTQVTNLVNGAEIWICPLANPDGTYYNSSPVGSTLANSRRYNKNLKDLNRNYIDPQIGDPSNSGDFLNYPIQPETYAFMNFADKHHFNMAINFHGGAEVINYPWDTWATSENPNADAAWWERVCTNYITTARLINSSYMTDVVSDGVTEGGDWYTITGGRQDYMNYFKQCREVTIELDQDKTTPTENLNTKWNENYASLLNFMQESLYGVRGIITDSCSSQPIRAKVWVNSYDQANDSSQVYSGLPVGNYHKYMNAGTYSITYSAPGYKSKTINNVVLTNGNATTINVTLAPSGIPDAQFTINMINSCTGTVQFTNTSSGSTNFVWFFGDGNTSTQTNPVHTYLQNGIYTVKLRAINCKGKDSLVMTNYITIDMPVQPVVTDASKCGPGTLALSASGSGTVKWYDVPSGGNPIDTGNTYTTPSLANTTTYYVTNSITPPLEYVGKTDSSGGGDMYTNIAYYLQFDCTSPVILKSVKVYASTAGNRTIEVRGADGNPLSPAQSATINIPQGESRINLNFTIPTGSGLSLRCTTTPNLFRNSGGITYPYDLNGKITITGTNATSLRYYFFYDWEVQDANACESSRVPVVAAIYSEPAASFTDSTYGLNAEFTNTSTNTASCHWNFGDGDTSNLLNPSHTYPSYGTYHVLLTVYNGDCIDTVSQNVIIEPPGMPENSMFEFVSIYPNPARQSITLTPGKTTDGIVEIDIFSITGNRVFSRACEDFNHKVSIDVSSLSDGVYLLRLQSSDSRKYFKILVSE